MTENSSRDTLVVEDAVLISKSDYAGDQVVMRLRAPRIATRALPGHFVHIRCDQRIAMRRPMSIMRAQEDWIEILFKIHGEGTAALGAREVGDSLSLIGPIGVPFKLTNYRARSLLIGGGVGIPPMVFLADHMRHSSSNTQAFVVMGSEVPFPFTVKPSQRLISGIPAHVIGSMPLLEDWGVANRLASQQGYAGCFDGLVTELADAWIAHHNDETNNSIEIFACGPTPMLKAVTALAARHAIPCQISLEEYMACAVGGCAGCTVAVQTEQGLAMKRVCVDGPVFDAHTVVFD